jgi:hypothetical protein
LSAKHQLPISPLNKAHEKNTFDIEMLGIDGNWAYTMTDADLADVLMEGFESL